MSGSTISGAPTEPVYTPPPPPPPPPPPVETEAAAESAPPPEGVDPQVQQAVDATISPEATPEQRASAYEQTQGYYDTAASGGDFTGIDDATLQVQAIQEMTDAGIPTRFDPEVIAAVDQTVLNATTTIDGYTMTGATSQQILDAYQATQEYVDSVGGIGDAGILAEALPQRADELMRAAGIPTEASAATAYVEEALVGFDDMTPEEQAAAIVEASARLEQMTLDVDPETAAIIASQALGPLEAKIGHVEASGVIVDGWLMPAWTSLAKVGDHIANASNGGPLLDRIANALYDSGGGPGNHNLLGPLQEEGVGMAVFLRMAEIADARFGEGTSAIFLDMILSAAETYQTAHVEPAVDAFSEHTAELNWLIQSLGPGATPEQIEQATQQYIDAHPGWQETYNELQADVAAHGSQLLQQIEALQNLPLGLSDHQDAVNAAIKDMLEDPKNGYAISVAAATNPEALSELDLAEFAALTETLGLTDKGLSTVKAIASAHVQHNVLGALANMDPNDPAAIANARAQIATLRDPAIAQALGLDPAQLDQLNTAVDELQNVLPQNGETLSQADVQARLAQLDERLNSLSAFEANQPLGQVFRGIGVLAGAASLYGATHDLINDPSLENAISVLAESAGMATAIGELAAGMGAIPENSPWARFSTSSTVGKVLGVVGIGLGLAGVVESLSQGDLAQAGIGVVGVGGAALALFGTASWAGPVGVAIGLLAALGSFGLNLFRANEAENQLEDASKSFLQSLGFDEETAEVLSDFSGDGYSSVGFLIEYGESKGLTHAETVAWLNSIPASELAMIRDSMNHLADDRDGAYDGAFPTTTPDDATYDDATYGSLATDYPYAIGTGDLTPASTAQFDIMLEALGLTPPN